MAVEIVICMGSSCFARGNEQNLKIIERYLKETGLDVEVKLSGSGCEERCSEGPNLMINGKRYSRVGRETLIDLLKTCSDEVKD